ncbi:cytochrome c oxidase subunit 4 [Nocardioides currus]|uniref:Cytochrome c oxidase polypeptide 4 n=1 Tax=Nocardioides currus TaxID=2133958 RepID=A0A2R7YWD6_9ACTN|nr:cytochrome c oxidase subunit 4 [Nocardioides currus]PUA80633.1 cytochrome C oxidase subunit IV [Nocardioides currus]
MKHETWLFVICTVFLVLVTPAYWLITGDWTGTSALTMTTLLTLMVSLYLGVHAARMDPRPEDRKDGEIADGAGELGFFPPYSWWPLWCAMALGTVVFATAMAAWWLFIIGGVIGAVTLSGWIFEYYRGEHAH